MKIYVIYIIIVFVLFALSADKANKDTRTESLITTCSVTFVFCTIVFTSDIMLSLCETLISFTDANDHSMESFLFILNRHFVWNTLTAVIIVLYTSAVLLLLTVLPKSLWNYVWNSKPDVYIPCMIICFLLLRAINWHQTKSSFTISDAKGLDYGTGMAYSYYYGYLRIILPSTESGGKGIVKKIMDFEDNHNVTFSVHKLFILIPSSAFIPPDLKEASYQWMENTHELEEEKRNRAGVIGRRYRNNIYKIYPGGERLGITPEYAAVEGATPLLTFFEVQKHNHLESNVYKQYKNEIITVFYKKLQEILQSQLDTKDLCELIYYDDCDSNGVKINIAKIILDRIFKLKQHYI